MKTDNSVSDQLLIEEYKSCRELIGRNIEIIERTETYAIGGIGAIFVYSISTTDPIVAICTAWAPLIIAILGRRRFIGIDDVIDKINNYLVEIEDKHPEIGWTKSYRKQNSQKTLKKSRYSIWRILIVSSLIGGSFVTWQNSRLAWGQLTSIDNSVVAKSADK